MKLQLKKPSFKKKEWKLPIKIKELKKPNNKTFKLFSKKSEKNILKTLKKLFKR